MARRRNAKHDRRSHTGRARRARLAGLGGGAGAVLAFGMSPLLNAADARADILDGSLFGAGHVGNGGTGGQSRQPG